MPLPRNEPSNASRSRALVWTAAVAGVAILIAGGVIVWHRVHAPQAQATPAPPPVAEPPAGGGQPPAPPPSIYDTPPATPATAPPPPAPPAPRAPASTPPASPTPTAPPKPETPPASRPAPPAPDRPAPPPAPAPTPATADPLLTFSSVKMLAVEGRKGKEQDVLLNFVGGHITVVAKKGGTAIRSVPYPRLVRATYVHARDPRWNRSVASPPRDLDVPGGFLGRPVLRRWLTLQTASDYVILRLEDDNWRRVLSAVERRTGLTVRRPSATSR